MIPRLDAALIRKGDPETLAALKEAATGVGFATVYNTALTAERVTEVIETYRNFFKQPEAQKREIDMLFAVTKQVEGHTICALGDAAAWPIQGLIRNFRHVIEERIDAYTYKSTSDGAVPSVAAE